MSLRQLTEDLWVADMPGLKYLGLHLLTRLYLKAAGLEGQIGWSRLLRVVYRDHRAARASLVKLLAHDFDRIVLAHGAVIETGGRDALERTFDFLRG